MFAQSVFELEIRGFKRLQPKYKAVDLTISTATSTFKTSGREAFSL